MSKLRIGAFSISIDGFGAGVNQSLENPLGVGGMGLHNWLFPTKTLQSMLFNNPDGETGVDDDFARRAVENIGAWILGRNMFTPSRGPWPDDDKWQGWWGDEPPYHVPVYVLTHHPRDSFAMKGGTTFHFVEGIENALARAKEAAGGKDVRIGGGAQTIRSYLRTGLVDEMHFAISPVLLGTGEHVMNGLDLRALGYDVVEHVTTKAATHIVLQKTRAA